MNNLILTLHPFTSPCLREKNQKKKNHLLFLNMTPGIVLQLSPIVIKFLHLVPQAISTVPLIYSSRRYGSVSKTRPLHYCRVGLTHTRWAGNPSWNQLNGYTPGTGKLGRCYRCSPAQTAEMLQKHEAATEIPFSGLFLDAFKAA